MTKQGERQVELIQQDLACPGCDYNLRGLAGAEVTCPECGSRHDVAELIARRWIGPWQTAPGFTTLIKPVSIITLGGIFVLGLCSVLHYRFDLGWVGVLVGFTVIWWWIMSIIRLGTMMPNGRAITLSIMAHALFGGYLLSVFGGLGLTLAAVASNDPAIRVAGPLPLVAGIAGVWLCRRGERWIAEQCIRHYLSGIAAK